MNLLRSKPRTIFGSILGALMLAPTLLLGGAAHADTVSPPTGTVPTNLPTAYAFPAPPQGFNPATASTADLQRYGFPLPPDRTKYPTEYQQWLQVMSHATHRVVPAFSPQPGVTHATSRNWSGAAALTGQLCLVACVPTYPVHVWGAWTVPSVAGSNRTSYSSTWLGLDGDGNTQVEQIGTEQDATSYCFPFRGCFMAASYYPWFELYPDYSQAIGGFPISPGNVMYADVTYNGSYNTLAFWLEDFTTGQYTAFTVTAKYRCGCVSAEWITERPTINGSLPALADYGSTQFADASFESDVNNTFPAITSTFHSVTLNMVNAAGTPLAYGSAPGTNVIESAWSNYGP